MARDSFAGKPGAERLEDRVGTKASTAFKLEAAECLAPGARSRFEMTRAKVAMQHLQCVELQARDPRMVDVAGVARDLDRALRSRLREKIPERRRRVIVIGKRQRDQQRIEREAARRRIRRSALRSSEARRMQWAEHHAGGADCRCDLR